MLINMRNALMAGKRLPYDSEVEYLRMSDGQYTTIEYTPTRNTSCDVFIRPIVLTPKNGSRGFFGSEDANNVQSFAVIFENDEWATDLLQFRFGVFLNVYPVAQFQVGSVYRITLNENGGFVNGVRVVPVKTSSPSGSLQTTFGVGCYIRNGVVKGYKGVYDYFGLKIVENASIVRDLIPVRFTNEQGQSEGAMYDRANPTVGMNPDGSARTDGLYRNRGSGAFLYGNDI